MDRCEFIADRLREVLLNGQWIANTNCKEQLLQVNLQQAVYKIHDLNTIAALTFHLNYYFNGILSFFETGQLTISDKFSFNLPPVDSESDWERLRSQFLDNSQLLIQKIEDLPEAILNEPFANENTAAIYET